MTAPLDEKGMEAARASFVMENSLKRAISAYLAASPSPSEMTPEEIRLENLKQMAGYAGPIVSFDVQEPYYLASCDKCGWFGSSELCGTDSFGDDSDVYCPRCSASGADCGKVAEKIETLSAQVLRLTEENEALRKERDEAITLLDHLIGWIVHDCGAEAPFTDAQDAAYKALKENAL